MEQISLALDLAERFAAKYVPDEDDCWRWTGTVDPSGFGRFWFDGRMEEAHRVAWRIYLGEIPDGWYVQQTCWHRWCVNPEHLECVANKRPGGPQPSGRPWKNIYNRPEWQKARMAALLRDGNRCTVARFFTGSCSAVLHVHHLVPLEDGGAPYDLDNLGTACSRHHPMWESLRRKVVAELGDDLAHRIVCPHQHRSAEARAICERRLRERAAA